MSDNLPPQADKGDVDSAPMSNFEGLMGLVFFFGIPSFAIYVILFIMKLFPFAQDQYTVVKVIISLVPSAAVIAAALFLEGEKNEDRIVNTMAAMAVAATLFLVLYYLIRLLGGKANFIFDFMNLIYSYLKEYLKQNSYKIEMALIVTAFASACAYGLYYFRHVKRGLYGASEIVFGIVSIYQSVIIRLDDYIAIGSGISKYLASNNALVIQFFAGIYIMVRGIVNINDAAAKEQLLSFAMLFRYPFSEAIITLSSFLRRTRA